MRRLRQRRSPRIVGTRAFSLVEVILSLGVVSFSLVALIGLFALGLKVNKESSDHIDAANVTSLLLTTLRAMPTNLPPGFAIPSLNRATQSGTMEIDADGAIASQAAGGISRTYGLSYSVGTNSLTGPRLSNVYILLWWPASATAATNNPSSCYEVTAQISLP